MIYYENHCPTAPDAINDLVVMRQPVARFMIYNSSMMVLISVFLYFTPNLIFSIHNSIAPDLRSLIKGSAMDMSYSLIILVVGRLLKSLIQAKIPLTVARLYAVGALDIEHRGIHIKQFEKSLGSPVSHAVGIAITIAIVGFYAYAAITSMQTLPQQPMVEIGAYAQAFLIGTGITAIGIDLLFAYAGGVALWIIIITMWEFRRLALSGRLQVISFHPDGCGGLSAIGQLLFSMSFIFVVIGLFLAGWLLYGHWIDPNFPNFNIYHYWFEGGLLSFIAVSAIAFVVPLLDVHRLMCANKQAHELTFLQAARRITETQETMFSREDPPSTVEVENGLAQVESIRKAYQTQMAIPTWPVNIETWIKFFSSQLAMWSSIPLTIFEIWDKLPPFVTKLFGVAR